MPTWNELIEVKHWEGFEKKSIFKAIAMHNPTDCKVFGSLLLNSRLVVADIRNRNSDNLAFVYEVLDNWCSQCGSAIQCTWVNLINCMERAGLDGQMVAIIKANVCRLFFLLPLLQHLSPLPTTSISVPSTGVVGGGNVQPPSPSANTLTHTSHALGCLHQDLKPHTLPTRPCHELHIMQHLDISV